MKTKGINLAIFGSILSTSKLLIIKVDTNHQKIKLTKYLAPELAWF